MRRRELLLLGTGMLAARAVRAQQKVMPVIGFLSGGSPGPFASFVAAFSCVRQVQQFDPGGVMFAVMGLLCQSRP